MRVGIGPLPGGDPWEDFVLAPFAESEREQIDALMPELVAAADGWLREGAAS